MQEFKGTGLSRNTTSQAFKYGIYLKQDRKLRQGHFSVLNGIWLLQLPAMLREKQVNHEKLLCCKRSEHRGTACGKWAIKSQDMLSFRNLPGIPWRRWQLLQLFSSAFSEGWFSHINMISQCASLDSKILLKLLSCFDRLIQRNIMHFFWSACHLWM